MSSPVRPDGQYRSAPPEGFAVTPARPPEGMVVVSAASVPAQAWRNGGGRTRELLTWPADAPWQLRISRADIERDGPFSAFPQIERWFAVLQGQGVVLGFEHGERSVRSSDDALHFDGAAAPACRLLDGATQDLNLMARNGAGAMRRWHPGQPCTDACAMRGLYSTVAGRWRSDTAAFDLAADTLLWSATPSAGRWTFCPLQPDAMASVWWLGFTPRG